MPHHINWVEVATPNPQATKEFFGKVFGWDFQPSGMMPDYHIFNAGAGPQGAVHGHVQDGPRLTVYLYAADIDATLAAVQAAGGTVVTPKMFVGDAVGHIAHFSDPNGNLFGLWDREGFASPK
jgi:predicted enzyme related to lactoylglutathione lyase